MSRISTKFITDNAVTNPKLATMANNTFKGNVSGGTAAPLDLNPIQVTAALNTFVGDSGSGGVKGLVPAPASGEAAALEYLSADGTFKPVAFVANVVSASAAATTASATDSIISGMTLTPVAGTYMVMFSGVFTQGNPAGALVNISIYGATTQVAASIRSCSPRVTTGVGTAVLTLTMHTHAWVTVNGSQAITVQWNSTGGATASVTNRSMDIFRAG